LSSKISKTTGVETLRSTFSFIRGNVLVLIVCRCLWRLSNSIAWPYFSLYILALGGSPSTIGLVNAIGGLAGLILYPLGGYLADHEGRVKLVGVATYFSALSFSFFIFAQDWTMLAGGRFFRQLILFYSPALTAIMADSLPPGRRGIGFATAMAIPGAVGIMAPYIGGYMIDLYGGGDAGVRSAMRICYAASLFIGLLVATIRLRFLKETLERSDSRASPRNVLSLLRASYASMLESMRWMSRTLWSLALIEVVTIFFVSIAAPFWVVYVTDIIGLTPSQWGTLMLILGIVRISLSIPVGYIVDRYGSRRLIIVAMALAPIPVFLFIFCKTFLEVLAVLLLLGFVNTIIWPAFSTLLANLVPRERRGRLLSILGRGIAISWGGVWAGGFIVFIPMSLGTLIGGYIYEANPMFPWLILGGALVLCLILSIMYIHEPENPEE